MNTGDYVDEGWVDESAPQGNAFAGLGSMFGGLFGGSKTDETKVVAAVSPSPPMVSNSQWEPLTDEASGSIYYWNKQTGETAWEMPK